MIAHTDAAPDVPLYDRFSADYDRFVNWKNRLAFEMPFLTGRLAAAGAQRVLDVACGTGQHAIALARAGYQVTGADLSQAMITAARQNAAESGVDVEFVQAGFGQLAGQTGSEYDALLCLGNSLPHALTRDALEAAILDFRAVLRPGGLLMVQNRNFDLVWRRRDRFMPPETYQDGDREWIFFRFYDFGEETITFHVNMLQKMGAGWSSVVDSTELRPIFEDEITSILAAAGFTRIERLGGLAEEPFDPESSGNLVLVARA
jgi:glycine/sarcosine N-methyltransferase